MGVEMLKNVWVKIGTYGLTEAFKGKKLVKRKIKFLKRKTKPSKVYVFQPKIVCRKTPLFNSKSKIDL
jgi:hypothetical protein